MDLSTGLPFVGPLDVEDLLAQGEAAVEELGAFGRWLLRTLGAVLGIGDNEFTGSPDIGASNPVLREWEATIPGMIDIATDIEIDAAVTEIALLSQAVGGDLPQLSDYIHPNSYRYWGRIELYYLRNAAGEIQKIGITSDPSSRYSAALLAARGLTYEVRGVLEWRLLAAVAEFNEIAAYAATHNWQPPPLQSTYR